MTATVRTRLDALDGEGSVTAGTVTASEVVVVDNSKNIGTFGTLTASILSAATIAGIANRAPASITGTDSITAAEHANRLNVITGTSAATLTLPEATGTGNIYPFIFGQVNTNGTVFVTADTTNCDIRGSINILDADSNAQTAYPGNASDDTITFDGTTKGGQIGDIVVLIDIATDKWAVWGQVVCPTGSNVADMFSAAV